MDALAFLQIIYCKHSEPSARMKTLPNANCIARFAHQFNAIHLLNDADSYAAPELKGFDDIKLLAQYVLCVSVCQPATFYQEVGLTLQLRLQTLSFNTVQVGASDR